MNVGIGYEDQEDATMSGKLSAESALRNGTITRPDLAVAFCSGKLDADAFFQGLRSVLGVQTPIIGGSAIGIITDTELSYDGYASGVAVFQGDSLNVEIATTGALDKDEEAAGRRLATQLTRALDDKMLLMFYDSIRVPAQAGGVPPVMNASPPLIRGIESVLGRDFPIGGAGVVANYQFGLTRQFCGTHVNDQSVVGALVRGDVEPYFQIMHGCALMDGIYHTITKMDGAIIYEVDGKPIVETIDAIYGSQEWQSQIPVRRLSIGVNMGEKYAAFDESKYVIRLISGVLPDKDGIVIFEPDLETGVEIQFMIRDTAEIIESVRENVADIMTRIAADGRTPLFGLYIDCAGRSGLASDTLFEEAEEVMSVFHRKQIPLLGFYSGVEIAPFLDENRGLDWTGVLVVLADGE